MMAVSPRASREDMIGNRQASREKGKAGEDQALSYLVRQGLALIERNFRCRGGEIDLVMRDGDEIVFVEVRMRSGGGFGGAAGSVTSGKQARLVLAAQVFLQRFRSLPACRFDVVAFEDGHISWLKNAIET